MLSRREGRYCACLFNLVCYNNSMTANELRNKFLDFFKSKGHAIIPSASLIPEETDPSVLFTTAGMHPLVPYLLGEDHPGGKRVANVQKCIRTADIEDVGDNRHLTFFEMMGNWSFGDYFKKEAIEWSWEFLTEEKWLGLDSTRIYATVFKGENGIPRDDDSIEIWKKTFNKAGMNADVAEENEVIKNNVRIIPLNAENNFWIASATGPCGPDTEMFYDTRPEEGELNDTFQNLINTGRLIEIWNDVFMEFNKTVKGKYEKLSQQNVDTGMGVERTLAVLNGKETVFDTELFQPIFEKIKSVIPTEVEGSKKLDSSAGLGMTNTKSYRIIADHIKASVFIISDGVIPSNTGSGYVLRRLIRRAVRYGKLIGIESNFLIHLASIVVKVYNGFYPELEKNKEKIFEELEREENKFVLSLKKNIPRSNKRIEILKRFQNKKKEMGDEKFLEHDSKVSGIDIIKEWKILDKLEENRAKTALYNASAGMAFVMESTYGYPHDLFFEDVKSNIIGSKEWLDKATDIYLASFIKHQELSRTASAGMFKGGLADAGEKTAKLHTATHLSLAALRELINPEIYQKGSNITAERLRFDFNYPQKLTPEQIKKVEDLVNKKIKENIPVEMTEMKKEEALKIAKVSFDPSKYGDVVKVYKINGFSIEVCGGPHAKSTGELGKFKIIKEEASSAGVRRIKAILDKK